MQETIFISLPLSQLQALIVDSINGCLDSRNSLLEKKLAEETWFNAKQLCDYLPNKPKLSTVYAYTRANTIPFHKDAGEKNLRFLRSEIDAWLKRGKKKSSAEIEAEADAFLSTYKRKGGPHVKGIR